MAKINKVYCSDCCNKNNITLWAVLKWTPQKVT